MNAVTQERRALYQLAGRDSSRYDNPVLLDICTACGADCIYCPHQAADKGRNMGLRICQGCN